MKRLYLLLSLLLGLALPCCLLADDAQKLPTLDPRTAATAKARRPSVDQEKIVGALKARVPDLEVDFDAFLGTPKFVRSREGFLTGPDGKGKLSAAENLGKNPGSDSAIKALLEEHRDLFGIGPEALDAAVKQRDYLTEHNGLRSVHWEQRLDGIPVYEAVFSAHLTRAGEIINLSSLFVPAPEKAAGADAVKRRDAATQPRISASDALHAAIAGVEESATQVTLLDMEPGPTRKHRFQITGLPGEARAWLVWFPLEPDRLRLCWAVELTRRHRGESYRVLIDAESGVMHLRRCLTFDLAEATYRVFTSDSPSPFSPGHSTPSSDQPVQVERALVTLAALSTNASPAGWISDADNETRGNNVDAHLDRDGDNAPDLPRPRGVPFRTFDFPMDLSQPPVSYSDAAVVQLFFWCNWMHDRLYELGFTEAAGNFQKDNFGRGGIANDSLQADAQDGSGVNNANFTAFSDGTAPRMQMYLFNGPDPARDGDLDAEVVLHEYTHGLSERLVGGGVGLSAAQSMGMGEGWSDFYALALLSEAGDDVDGAYGPGGYLTYRYSGLNENYYFGIRRYPYSTDLTKNPLTFKDIDPDQLSSYPGIPRNPTANGSANAVHRQGEVWCSALWEVRANLIRRHGYSQGNQIALRLVTDGMRMSPPNPSFLQARDAILDADKNGYSKAYRRELWAGFSKRGMGVSARGPDSNRTSGIQEAFDAEDALVVRPEVSLDFKGVLQEPLTSNPLHFSVTNEAFGVVNWKAICTSPWVVLTPSDGQLTNHSEQSVAAFILSEHPALSLAGSHSTSVLFTNLTSGQFFTRQINVVLQEPNGPSNPPIRFFAEEFTTSPFDLGFNTITFSPKPSDPTSYTVCRTATDVFPTDPTAGIPLSLLDDSYAPVVLTNNAKVSLFGLSTNLFFIGSNGDIAYELDPVFLLDPLRGIYTNFFLPGIPRFFEYPRFGALYSDLNPAAGGTVTWKQLADRVVITFAGVPQFGIANSNTFQVELFYSGVIRFTYLRVELRDAIVGISAGTGLPNSFASADFSAAGSCSPLSLTFASEVTEGEGFFQGTLSLDRAVTTNLVVRLTVNDTNQLQVPDVVVIPAGEATVFFDVAILDDALVDGSQVVTVQAAAEGLEPITRNIVVHDNEPAVLTVSIPIRSREGDPPLYNGGVVRVNPGADRDVVVRLSSSDPSELVVPETVVIPAGQGSVAFDLSVVNDQRLDGLQTVTVLARVENWDYDIDAIQIWDDENTNLILQAPVALNENDGVRTNAASVQLAGTVTSNVVIQLAASPPNRLAVQSMLIVTQGSRTALFSLGVIANTNLTGPQGVTISATAPGFISTSLDLTILDDESPAAPTQPTPAHLATNVFPRGTLAWKTERPEVLGRVRYTVYLGRSEIFTEADRLAETEALEVPLPELLLQTTYYWQVIAQVENVQVAGPVWSFTTISLDHFELSDVPSPQFVNQPFPLTITARGRSGEIAYGYEDLVALQGWVPLPTHSRIVITEVDTGSDRVEFQNVSGTNIDISRWEISLYDWSVWPAPRVVFSIPGDTLCRAGDLFQLRKYPSQFFPGTYPIFNTGTNIYWNNNPFDNPVVVVLRDAAGEVVDVFSAVDADLSRITEPIALPPGVWNGAPLAPNLDSTASYQRVGLRDTDQRSDWEVATNSIGKTNIGLMLPFLDVQPVAIEPAVLTNFTNGSWTGEVTVLGPAPMVFIEASDPQGHRGVGRPFQVVTINDASVRFTRPQQRIILGQPFTILLAVTNTGPQEATGLAITNTFPPSLELMDVQLTQGTYSLLPGGNGIISSLGNLGSNGFALIHITFISTNPAPQQITAALHRDEGDGSTANNVDSVAVVPTYPVLLVSPAGVREGHSGSTNLNVTFRLSEAFPETIRVQATTRNGMAEAGVDYVAYNGPVVFAPGATNVVLSIPVLGDTLDESNETFQVVLANPMSVILGATEVTCTITNDDFQPTISITDTAVVEGDQGTTQAVFRISISAPSGKPVGLNYTTLNGDAVAGLDYVPISGRLTFTPGTTNFTVSVPVIGDTYYESNKSFTVRLINPSYGSFLKDRGVGRILDDDSGQLHHFRIVPAIGTQRVDTPFAVTVLAQDAENKVVQSFAGPVYLRGGVNATQRTVGAGSLPWEYPFGAYYHDLRMQVLYTANEIGGAGLITALGFDVTMVPGQTLSNWTIRLKHTRENSLVSREWDNQGWTVVYQGNHTLVSTGWVTFHLATPFLYNSQSNLFVDLSFDNSSFSSDGQSRSLITNRFCTRLFRTDSAFGNPLSWSGSSPLAGLSAQMPALRFTLERGIALSPTNASKFVDGIWQGNLTVAEQAPGLVLTAIDANGLVGRSAPIQVLYRDDDADGLPDFWETQYELDPGSAGDAHLDPDQDGLSNLQEYLAGTDPRVAGSTLRLTTALAPDRELRLRFTSALGKMYQLERRNNLNTQGWEPVSPPVPGTGSVVESLIKTTEPHQFYRVVVLP